MIEYGDLVEYKLRESIHGTLTSALPQRGIVKSIRLHSDNNTKTIMLNNGDMLVSSLHMVRRMSMRTLDTNRVLWNPVPTWKNLSEFLLEPTEYANTPSVNSTTNVNGAIDGTANEMDSPDLIPVCPLNSTNQQRKIDIKQCQRRDNQLRQKRICKSGQYVHWLKGDERLKEIADLDVIYRECLTVREVQGFRKLIGINDRCTYEREKYNLKERLRYRKKNWRPFRVLQQISFFPWLTSIKNKFSSTNSGHPDSQVQQLPMDSDGSYEQTERDLLFTEKTIEFEDTVSALKVRFCACCRENHIKEVRTLADANKEYICAGCSNKSVERDHYLRYNLQPIWYERIEGTNDHTNLKRDSEGNPIIRYDQPKELTSLTMAEKLLIRRCSPFIPALHLHSGYMAIEGHGVAFEQNIDEMCNELPQTKASTLTFLRQMGNKTTHDVHITSLRVRKRKVLEALRWLQLHHVDYHNIKIQPKNLDWMGDSKEQYLRDRAFRMKVKDKNEPKETPFVSRVQCLIDKADDDNIPFHMMGVSDQHRIPNATQSKPILELVKSVSPNERHKLYLFPSHGDQPIK